MSDCWKLYADLEDYLPELNLVHRTVNHTQKFIDPCSQSHTQNIESLWSVIKRKLRKEGTNNADKEKILNKIYVNLYRKFFFCE